MFDPRDKTTDIHQFIGEVNSLADKANVDKKDRKTVLFEHVPANLNQQLLGDSKDTATSALRIDKPQTKEHIKAVEVRIPAREDLKRDGKCFLCQKEGHIARNCPEKLNRIAALMA